jgi:hypothetical protein
MVRLLVATVAFFSLVGCTNTNVDAETSSTSDGELDSRRWKSVVRCEGAHIDSVDPETMSGQQLVIDDPGAAAYLRDRFNHAVAHDPFSANVGVRSDMYGPVLRPSGPREMVWALYGFAQFVAQPRLDFSASAPVTSGGELRLDVQKSTWEQDQGGGLFRKFTDLKVRLVRNGWREYHCNPGLSGDPPTCGSTGEGWNEWEVANWTFRGCYNQ